MLYEENKEEANNPKWEEFDKQWKHVHDWRTYINEEIRESWFDLSIQARCLVIEVAQECANREHWD